MDQLEFHDIRKDFDAMQSEPLAPYVTHSWLSDRLSRAPTAKRIRAYFDRRRPSELSENARRQLLSCGRWHERALRFLQDGLASQTDLLLVVKRASRCMSNALGDFYRIQYDEDLNHCLTDFESLMMTSCLFLSMYTSRADWAARCSKVLKNSRLRLKSRKFKTIPVEEDFEDADTVLNMVLSSYREAVEKVQRKERSCGRENLKKGKGRGGTTRRCARKEPLEVFSLEYVDSAVLFQPPFAQNQETIHSGHNFPVENDRTRTFWPGSRVPSLGFEFSSPLVEYCATPTPAYPASAYEYPTANPAPQQVTTPNMVHWPHIAPKRHLSREDDLEFQGPSQRRRHCSPASLQAQGQSFTYNDAATLPLMAPIPPQNLDSLSSTQHNKAWVTPQNPDYSIWSEGEKLVDLTPCDGFHPSDFQAGFYHLLSGYQDLGVMRPPLV